MDVYRKEKRAWRRRNAWDTSWFLTILFGNVISDQIEVENNKKIVLPKT